MTSNRSADSLKVCCSETTSNSTTTVHPPPDLINNMQDIVLAPHEAIADSGATGHFLLPNLQVHNKQIATAPLLITLPDGEAINSTHTGNLNIPGLPDKANEAHIVPGLAHSSLISIKQLCDNGCTVLFTKKHCKVYHKAELVLVGRLHPSTGLWIVPTNDKAIVTKPTEKYETQCAHNAAQQSSKVKLIQFLHQCAFSPPPSTWIKAINNGHFESWPGLTAKAGRKYLPDSTATAKGHLKKTPAGKQSTRKQETIKISIPQDLKIPTNAKIKLVREKISKTEDEADFFPQAEFNVSNHVFCWAALADQIDGTTYTDLTGRFPMMSINNKQYMFVAYDYTSNAIIVRAIKDRESKPLSRHLKTFSRI